MTINPTNRDKNWQKKALWINDKIQTLYSSMVEHKTCNLDVSGSNPDTQYDHSKGSSLKTQGSKTQAWQGRMVQGSKDGTLSVCGENVLGKVMFLSLSSRTSKASCLGGLNRFKREGATILKGLRVRKDSAPS